jgi:hypothetical protein
MPFLEDPHSPAPPVIFCGFLQRDLVLNFSRRITCPTTYCSVAFAMPMKLAGRKELMNKKEMERIARRARGI